MTAARRALSRPSSRPRASASRHRIKSAIRRAGWYNFVLPHIQVASCSSPPASHNGAMAAPTPGAYAFAFRWGRGPDIRPSPTKKRAVSITKRHRATPAGTSAEGRLKNDVLVLALALVAWHSRSDSDSTRMTPAGSSKSIRGWYVARHFENGTGQPSRPFGAWFRMRVLFTVCFRRSRTRVMIATS